MKRQPVWNEEKTADPGKNATQEEVKNMKNTLIYQSSEFDCGPTCMLNAIRYLFEREEIQPGVLKHIWLMGNDTYCDKGHVGRHGTSHAAMRYMADWLKEYGRGCHFPVTAAYLEGMEASVEPNGPVWLCLEQGGCAVMRCFTGKIPHYVLLTRVLKDGEIGLFDPYEDAPDFKEPGRRIVEGEPRVMNRAVRYDLLNRTSHEDYAMGEADERDILMISKTASENPEKEA